MKKVLGIMLASGLILSTAVAAMAAPTVKIGGEGNFGYDFAKNAYNGDKGGANFGDYAVTATSDITENITLFGKWKSGDLSGGSFVSDEVYAHLKFAPMNVKVGYYGFGFGGSKDILDVAWGDFKSNVGIQAETLIAEALSAKFYLPTRWSKEDKRAGDCEDNAFAMRFDFNKDKYGVGAIYGKTEWRTEVAKETTVSNVTYQDMPYDDVTAYTMTAYFKPTKELKTYVDYTTSTKSVKSGYLGYGDAQYSDVKDTDIIIGALYTPTAMPIEARFEYDLNNKGNKKESGYNPWGLRFGYKLTPNAKIEMNRNSKAYGSKEASIKLNLTF